eukprot:2341159-Pyramimonas_sp.AAC.1
MRVSPASILALGQMRISMPPPEILAREQKLFEWWCQAEISGGAHEMTDGTDSSSPMSVDPARQRATGNAPSSDDME